MALYLETVATANSYEYPDGWRHWVIAMARALKSLPFIGYMARTMLILDGRLGRWEYVKRGGFCGLISIFYGLVASAIAFLFSCISVDAGATADSILQFVLDIPSCIAAFLLMRARLHDLDHTGWLSLLMFITLVNILFVIYILFFRGTVGDNRYGRDPLLED